MSQLNDLDFLPAYILPPVGFTAIYEDQLQWNLLLRYLQIAFLIPE